MGSKQKTTEPASDKAGKKITKPEKLRRLFFSTLYLSAFTFGGGYVIVTLLKNKFVDQLHWIDDEEMLDLVAIAQSSPGAIAVNGAIVVGYKICGLPGILCAVLGAIIPPFVILSVISFFYDAFRTNFVAKALLSGMRSGVSAVIVSTVWDMGSDIVKEKNKTDLLIMFLAFAANYCFRVNVVLIILLTAVLGAVRALLGRRKEQA